MPVEIRELQITGIVQENNAQQPGSATGSQSTTNNNQAIIAACVEQVLEILKQKNER
jgi:hypothetical protein